MLASRTGQGGPREVHEAQGCAQGGGRAPHPRGVIRLRRIYNFLLFHANILQLSYTFGNFLYYFWD